MASKGVASAEVGLDHTELSARIDERRQQLPGETYGTAARMILRQHLHANDVPRTVVIAATKGAVPERSSELPDWLVGVGACIAGKVEQTHHPQLGAVEADAEIDRVEPDEAPDTPGPALVPERTLIRTEGGELAWRDGAGAIRPVSDDDRRRVTAKGHTEPTTCRLCGGTADWHPYDDSVGCHECTTVYQLPNAPTAKQPTPATVEKPTSDAKATPAATTDQGKGWNKFARDEQRLIATCRDIDHRDARVLLLLVDAWLAPHWEPFPSKYRLAKDMGIEGCDLTRKPGEPSEKHPGGKVPHPRGGVLHRLEAGGWIKSPDEPPSLPGHPWCIPGERLPLIAQAHSEIPQKTLAATKRKRKGKGKQPLVNPFPDDE